MKHFIGIEEESIIGIFSVTYFSFHNAFLAFIAAESKAQ